MAGLQQGDAIPGSSGGLGDTDTLDACSDDKEVGIGDAHGPRIVPGAAPINAPSPDVSGSLDGARGIE